MLIKTFFWSTVTTSIKNTEQVRKTRIPVISLNMWGQVVGLGVVTWCLYFTKLFLRLLAQIQTSQESIFWAVCVWGINLKSSSVTFGVWLMAAKTGMVVSFQRLGFALTQIEEDKPNKVFPFILQMIPVINVSLQRHNNMVNYIIVAHDKVCSTWPYKYTCSAPL